MLKRKSAFILISLLIGLSSAQPAFAENNPNDSIRICEDDEITIICDDRDTMYSRFYNCYGKYLGSMGYHAGFYNIETVKIGTLYVAEEKDRYVVYRLGDPLTISGIYPKENTYIRIHENGYSVETYSPSSASGSSDSSQDSTFTIYDEYGVCLFEKSGFCSVIEVQKYDQDYYIAWHSYSSQNGNNPDPSPYHLEKINSVSGEHKEIYSPQTYDQSFDYCLNIYGDHIIWGDHVLDLNGNLLMSGITLKYEQAYRFEYGDDKKLLSAIGYDQNLMPHEIDVESYEAHQFFTTSNLEYNDVFLGESTELLNGHTCEGWVPFCGPNFSILTSTSVYIKDHYPYSRIDDNHVLVWIDDHAEEFFLKKNEKLNSLNDDFYVTYSTKKDLSRLRKRGTGEVLQTGRSMILGDGYCLNNSAAATYSPETYELTLDPETGEEIVSVNTLTCSEIYPWKNGLLFMVRGAYRGLVDPKGNWVIKCTSVEM